MPNVEIPADTHPFIETRATRMVAAAIKEQQRRHGLSQRDLAKRIGYKTSVVLSHIAVGRVGVPLDRVMDFARVLEIDPVVFLIAALEQKHPDIDFRSAMNIEVAPQSPLKAKLEAIAGCTLDDLDPELKALLEEVVGAARPRRRWLTLGETQVIDMIRSRMAETNIADFDGVDLLLLESALRSVIGPSSLIR